MRFRRAVFGQTGLAAPNLGVHPQEAAALTLSSALAQRSLEWRPRLDVSESLAWTADWYRAYKGRERIW